MTRFLLLSSVALVLLLFAAVYSYTTTSRSIAVIYDPDIADIIFQVTPQTLEYDLNGLTGERPVVIGGSPYTILCRQTYKAEAITMATQYVYEQFTSLGLDTTYHSYVLIADWGSGQRFLPRDNPRRAVRNVIAEKPGRVDPTRIYLLTAHMDSMPIGVRAPGADDNASGSVAVLTAARLLAPHDFAYTIRFVLLTGEEQGLQGSAAYAADCAAQGQDIRGVINLDMIAYDSDPDPIIDLYAVSAVPASQSLTLAFARVIDVYGLDLVPDQLRTPEDWGAYSTDLASFDAQGFPTMLAIEDTDNFNSHYHTPGDRVNALNLDYYTNVTRAVIATIAHLAVPVRGEGR
ncbi:MAG: Zn-dependent exopeptidase M28 [Chloroflexi bacterium]|nr:Zn-dependent exopeptidase M28 [Chloroflexota bacterium]MBU1748299.1 Zn-dependent exopeptidase M28 [Chloroflexota bacterium]